MNFRTLHLHLSKMGYTEDEIENNLSDIAEELYDQSRDKQLEDEQTTELARIRAVSAVQF